MINSTFGPEGAGQLNSGPKRAWSPQLAGGLELTAAPLTESIDLGRHFGQPNTQLDLG